MILLALTARAAAQIKPAPDEIAGTVLSTDEGDLVLSLGSDQGVYEGEVVELWRPLRLKHPVSGQMFEDRFRIGTLVIAEVRRSMSLAKRSDKTSRPAERGDVVIAPKPVAPTRPTPVPVVPPRPVPVAPPPIIAPPPPVVARAASPSPPPSPAPTPAPTGVSDTEAKTVEAMLQALEGADIPTRVERYRVYVDAHPTSPYAGVLRSEIEVLRNLPSRPVAETISSAAARRPDVRSFKEVEGVIEGRPLRLTVELTEGSGAAVLHTRRRGTEGYKTRPMVAEGPGYVGVTLAANEIGPVDIEYFIDAVKTTGEAIAVLGTPDQPKVISVTPRPRAAAPASLDASASAFTDFADYNRLRGNDQAWQSEGNFGVRFGDVGIRAIRLGFGIYRGIGGSTHDLDVLHLRPRTVGLTYGYFETEVGFVRDFSIVGRGSVGLLDAGLSGGGQFLFRIGNDLRTNLLLGAEFLGGVGVKSIAELDLAVFPRFPIALRTEVSDQPAGTSSSESLIADASKGKTNVGARGIAQLGFRVIPSMVLFARASVEGRTIEHAGPGAGGGIAVTW